VDLGIVFSVAVFNRVDLTFQDLDDLGSGNHGPGPRRLGQSALSWKAPWFFAGRNDATMKIIIASLSARILLKKPDFQELPPVSRYPTRRLASADQAVAFIKPSVEACGNVCFSLKADVKRARRVH
jgi:hypothetical protein